MNMKKHFEKIRKDTMELAMAVSKDKQDNYTEDDLEILAESIDILNDMYEELYSKVFVAYEE